MSNRDRSEPPSGEEHAAAPAVHSSALPIGAPPRRKSVESLPALPPYHPPYGSAPSPKPLTLAPPRRPSDSQLPIDPTPRSPLSVAPPSRPSSAPIEPPSRPTSAPVARAAPSFRPPPPRPTRPVAAPGAEAVFAQSARSDAPASKAPSLADEIFTVPPPSSSVPDRFELDDLFTGAPARTPTVAPRKPTAPPKSLARAAPSSGDSTYASLPPLRLSAPPSGSVPPPRLSTPPLEGEAETSLQGSERAVAAHACMLALARASRSYLIYDPSNQAVRGFLDAVRGTFIDYLARYGELPLTVRPFELVLDQEVVYIERERERSLALKLFRDGVRKITLDADTTWQELTKLLEILSIRFVGVRHDEDDLVTLLWKAGFHHITIESIEGFVPDDDEDEMPAAERSASAFSITASAKVPADFDLPGPSLPPPVRVAPAEVSPEARDALVAETASPRLPQVTIDLIRQLLAVAGDPTDPLGFDEVAPLVREARDFLLSDSRLQQLRALYDVLDGFSAGHPELAAQLGPIVSGFFDARALQKLVRSVPHDAPSAPAELKQLLAALPYDPLPVLLELLGAERAENDRRILRELLEAYLPERADVVIARLREVRGSLAADLLRALSERLPDAPTLVASTLISGDDDELQMEFLRLTASARTDTSTRGVLVHLLRSPSELLRVRTVEAIGEHREPGAFTLLQRHADHRAGQKSSPEEMAAVGRAMTLVDPARAMEVFREWARPAGLIQRLMKSDEHEARARAAAAGLARHPDAEADTILREMATGATAETMRKVAEESRAERAQAARARS